MMRSRIVAFIVRPIVTVQDAFVGSRDVEDERPEHEVRTLGGQHLLNVGEDQSAGLDGLSRSLPDRQCCGSGASCTRRWSGHPPGYWRPRTGILLGTFADEATGNLSTGDVNASHTARTPRGDGVQSRTLCGRSAQAPKRCPRLAYSFSWRVIADIEMLAAVISDWVCQRRW